MPFYLVGILPTFPFCFETPFLFLTQYCELLPRNKPKLTHYIVIQLSCKISSVCLFCVCVCIRIRIMMRQQYHLHRLLLNTDATLPPINRSKLSSSYAGSDTNFDSNMVIILAALLCALICALGLNSIVRCALRCSQRLAFENPDRTAARLATTGLKRDALSQIPVVVYMSGLDTPTTDCPICLGEFVEGEKFIFDAAAKFCVDIATHQHGCCVLNRCIDKSVGKYQEKLVAAIAAYGLLLAQDAFRNYVVQYVIQEIPLAAAGLISQFEGHYVHLSMQKFSSHVVEKCLKHFEESRPRIIHELLSVPHFEQLLQDPFANYVIQSALEVSKEQYWAPPNFRRSLSVKLKFLAASRKLIKVMFMFVHLQKYIQLLRLALMFQSQQMFV